MTGKKGSTHYSLEIKLEAVRLFLEEGRTRADVAKILGLRSKKAGRDLGSPISPRSRCSPEADWTPSQGRRECPRRVEAAADGE